jgi:hypothetical protein
LQSSDKSWAGGSFVSAGMFCYSVIPLYIFVI